LVSSRGIQDRDSQTVRTEPTGLGGVIDWTTSCRLPVTIRLKITLVIMVLRHAIMCTSVDFRSLGLDRHQHVPSCQDMGIGTLKRRADERHAN